MALLGQRESASSVLIYGANWTGLVAYLYNEGPLFSAPTPTTTLQSIVHLQLGSELPSGNCITLTLLVFILSQGRALYWVQAIPQVVKATVPILPYLGTGVLPACLPAINMPLSLTGFVAVVLAYEAAISVKWQGQGTRLRPCEAWPWGMEMSDARAQFH